MYLLSKGFILSEREKRAWAKNSVYAEIQGRDGNSLLSLPLPQTSNGNSLLVVEQLSSSFALPPLPFHSISYGFCTPLLQSFLSPLLQLPLFFTRRNPVLSFYFKFFNLSYAVWSLPPTQLILDSFHIDQGPCFGFKKLSRFFPQNIRNYSSLVWPTFPLFIPLLTVSLHHISLPSHMSSSHTVSTA